MISTRSRFFTGAVFAVALLLDASLRAQPSAVAPLVVGPAAAKSVSKWSKDIAAFAEADRLSPPPAAPIVFTGSSSIRRWSGLDGDFSGYRVINRGFGGSQLSDLREFFEPLILHYRPRQVVIYSGSNDINAGKPVETVVDDLKAIVTRIHQELPETRVLYISNALNPARWAQRDKVREANRRIEAFLAQDPRDRYVDIVSVMMAANGEPRPDIFVADRLHMNRRGYELWIPLIKPLLVEP